jgi:hypothetical protein
MKNYLFIFCIISFILFSIVCKKIRQDSPEYKTVLNLEQNVEVQKVPAKVLFNNQASCGNKKNNYSFGTELVEGPDSTIYTLEGNTDKLLPFSSNGEIIKTIDIPGKWKGPYGLVNISSKYLYIPDHDGLKIFDINGNYLKAVMPPFIIGRDFSVGKNNLIYAHPFIFKSANPFKKEPFMISVYNAEGKEVNKIAPITSDSTDTFMNNTRSTIYYVITNEYTDYIWCIYKSFPIIRKYDQEGNFIEEIKFEGSVIDSNIIENKKLNNHSVVSIYESDSKDQSPMSNNQSSIIEYVQIFDNPIILKNGDLLVNISNYGAIQISGKQSPSKIIKRFKFELPEDILDPNRVNMVILHGVIYGYNHNTLVREK